MPKPTPLRNFLYVCRDCRWVDHHGADIDIDKCPYCGSDNWAQYALCKEATE